MNGLTSPGRKRGEVVGRGDGETVDGGEKTAES